VRSKWESHATAQREKRPPRRYYEITASDAPDLMYFASRQPNAGFGFSAMSLAARARGNPDAVAPQVRAALRAMDADIPLAGLESMESILYDSISSARFRTQLLVGFAVVALVLAVVGLYGMLAYSVTQRSREMGIRMTLGARPASVSQLVVRQGMLLVVAGIVLGSGGAFAATRLLGVAVRRRADGPTRVRGCRDRVDRCGLGRMRGSGAEGDES
jgi:putative ABC transport system permease protein